MYCSVLWHFFNVTDTHKMVLVKIQENALRFIYIMIIKVFMLISCKWHQKTHSLYIGCLKHIAQDLFKVINDLSQSF